MRRLWLFHLRAEEELAALRSRGRWDGDVTGAPAAALAALARPLEGGSTGFLRPGDRALGIARSPVAESVPLEGAAWCPTPASVEALARAGAPLPSTDSVGTEVLIAANARETFADLDPLPGATLGEDLASVRRAVLRPAPARPSGRPPAWILRHSLCAAGRGRSVVESWDARAETFTLRALALGPVHVTPFVDVVAEFAQHGRIGAAGEVSVGQPVEQSVRGGAWRAAAAAHDLEPGEARVLRGALDTVADRLAALGYRGPFGVDALRWTDSGGRSRFTAPTDVNGRYTMSFALGAPALMPGSAT